MTAPFYKVVTHSLSAYGGQDKAAARAMFEHQKKLIEQGQTQAHEVVMYSDGAILEHFILNEDGFQEVIESEFTQAEQAAMHSMRSRGFALAVFTPKEIATMSDTTDAKNLLEQRMVDAGNDFISYHENTGD